MKNLIVLLALLAVTMQLTGSPATKDFKVKGFHIDLRTEVMTPAALREFAGELASMGINTIVMEWEASFPYRNNTTISNNYAYSRKEVSNFIAYCDSTGIDVIPLQQCFGHVEYILRHDRYYNMREDRKEISQLCPLKIESAEKLFKDLFADMADTHKSQYIHIGGDETYLLGSCVDCRKKAETEGKSKLFVDYMKRMCDIIISLGKTPVMWADIIIKYPEAVALLPKGTIFVDWNYGWKTDLFGDIEKLYKTGVKFWGAPAIRSHPDNIYLTNWQKHFENQRTFIPYSRESGYDGIIMTSWSTSGLYSLIFDNNWEPEQMLPIRNVYPLSGFRILTAAYAESLRSDTPLDAQKFITDYAVSRFGLSATQASEFCAILLTEQAPLKRAVDTEAETTAVAQTFDKLATQINALAAAVKQNKEEFDHFVLMFDIRSLYLDFKTLESQYQSETFNASKAEELYTQTLPLKERSKAIDVRFAKLQSGFISNREIEQINRARNLKLNTMSETLARAVGKI